LDLTQNQESQAKARIAEHERAISARLREAYCWALVPEQQPGKPEVEWNEYRLKGSSTIAERVQQRLGNEGVLCRRLTSSMLKLHLEEIPLFRDQNHVEIAELVKDYARYLYLPKVLSSEVVLTAINEGISQINWTKDSFALADGYDQDDGRYRGLHVGGMRMLNPDSKDLVVRAQVAEEQFRQERKDSKPSEDNAVSEDRDDIPLEADSSKQPADSTVSPPYVPKEYHGSAKLDSVRVAKEVAKISEEIIQHLKNVNGAEITLSLEISAISTDGFSDQVIRTVTENGITLKVDGGFE
jgi:hypothetical protein